MEEELLTPGILRVVQKVTLKVDVSSLYRLMLISILTLIILLTNVIYNWLEYKKNLDSLQQQLKKEELAASSVYDKVELSLKGAEKAQNATIKYSKKALSLKVCSEVNRYNNKAQSQLAKYEKYFRNLEEYLTEYQLRYKKCVFIQDEINRLQKADKISKLSISNYTDEVERFHVLEKQDTLVKKSARKAKKLAQKLYEEYYPLMLKIVTGECGDKYYPTIDQINVMKVIENRVIDPEFPNTIQGVIFQPGQYQPTWDGSWSKESDKRTKRNVHKYLKGYIKTDMPDNIVYQAMFKQGDFVWAHVSNSVDAGHWYCGKYKK